VLQTWGDTENFMLGSFNALYSGWYAFGNPTQAMTVMADEGSLSWGNHDARVLGSEPRSPYNNSPSYSYNNVAETPWYSTYEGLSNIYDGLRAIDGDTTGLACVEVDCDRLRAYGKFVQGMGHALLAAYFDSIFILDETIDLFEADGSEIPQAFVPYDVAWTAAVGYFNEVATYSGGTWTLPNNVFGSSGNNWNGAELNAVAKSMMGHLRPMMARTPAQRDAVDWQQVINDVGAGMAGDIFLEGDGCDKWCNDYLYFSQITTSTTWNRADYKTIGQYDENTTLGNGTYGYQDWLSEAVPARNEFPMVGHPDRRIVGAGDTDGTEDGITFRYRGASAFPSSRGTYHYSFYSSGRFEGFPAAETGPMPWVLREGLLLNAAEGDLRLNGASASVTQVLDATRIPAGLPSAAGYNDAQAMDAIIYERRLENFGWCHGCAYMHARGEGALAPSRGFANGAMDKDGNPVAFDHQGLVEGTQLMFAPPGKELEILQVKIWTYGGLGNELGAGQGLGVSPVYGAAMVGTHSIQAFYVPMEESLRRKAERRSNGKALVRYVQ
jgi:hypothetical protein